jgi:glycosyltransferase involved in cell wall biosynthesis
METAAKLKPTVSFLIATYNRANYLDKCIESIFSQTFQDFEIIVVDDCSNDGTDKLIRENYADRVIYHRNCTNRGVAFTRNVAIDYASGKYLGFIDSDDILYNPKYLEIALNILEEDQNIVIFCCDTICIDANGNKISDKTFLQTASETKGLKLSSGLMSFEDMFFYGAHSCGAIVRKDIINDIGFLNLDYKIGWDEDFFIRVSAHKPQAIYFYNSPLTCYRIHNNSLSNNTPRLYLDRIKCRQEILAKNKAIKKRLGLRANKRLAELHIYLIDAYINKGKIISAIAVIFKSILLYPLILPKLLRHGLSFSKRVMGIKR